MQVEDLVRLYHGGHMHKIHDFFAGATLSLDKKFFCTTNEALAREACYMHGVHGSVLEIAMCREHYRYCLDLGLFEEKEYFGVIQYDGAREVIVQPGNGIRVINESLPHEFRPVPNLRGVNRVIEEIERAKHKTLQ